MQSARSDRAEQATRTTVSVIVRAEQPLKNFLHVRRSGAVQGRIVDRLCRIYQCPNQCALKVLRSLSCGPRCLVGPGHVGEGALHGHEATEQVPPGIVLGHHWVGAPQRRSREHARHHVDLELDGVLVDSDHRPDAWIRHKTA
eukprot:scaffold1550_cov245-Pinguiococcus_pyrenoidosus.AAC.5